jgi:flagellar biosynthesis regulator FlbT
MDNKYIVINSIDRDWSNDNSLETPYNFRVVFGNNSLYGTSNHNLNILINDTIKNANYITCQKIVIANRQITDKFRPTNNPYLLINIDNIEQITDASNNNLQNAISIMTPKIPISTTSTDYKYLEYININEQCKKINRTIPYMDIQIQTADGTLINFDNYQNDILNIQQIYYNTSTELLEIKTADYFTMQDFQEGDKITINGYLFRDDGYYESALFNNYINRKEGHIIQSINKSNPALLMYDTIYILPEGENSKVTGNFELKEWFNNLITITDIDSNIANDNSGKLINNNLQTSIFFKVITNNEDNLLTS